MNWMLKLVKIRKNVKHKGLASGSQGHSAVEEKKNKLQNEIKDPKIGSKKKIPLVKLNLLISLKRSSNSCNKTGVKNKEPMKELENLENK